MIQMICSILLALSAQNDIVLSTPFLYHGANRPVICQIDTRGAEEKPLSIVLLDAQGAILSGPVPVRAGRFDLLALLPDIAELDRAAWLQALLGGEPSGTPLIVQPLLSRQVPQVVRETLPTGARMSRITGWRDELDQPQEPGVDAAPPRPALPVRSGLRIYTDKDLLLETSEGNIRIALRPDHAPNTAFNMRHLAGGGFYRDIPFHRIVPLDRSGQPFVIQAGDPSGTGSGGPGYWLPIERSELPHDFGVISMARDLPVDSAGSQFFICLSRAGTARLDGNYCAFGQTVSGADVILRIAETELADVTTGRPRTAPVLRDVRLVPAPPRVPGAPRQVVRERPKEPARPTGDGRIDR